MKMYFCNQKQIMNNFSIAIHGGAGTLVKGMMTAEFRVSI